jgi:hypothetical protein
MSTRIAGNRRKAGRLVRRAVRVGVLPAIAVLVVLVPAASAAVSSSVSPQGFLIVQSSQSDSIAVTCGADGNVKVNGADPDTGPAACPAINQLHVTGDSGANVIDLGGVTRASFPNLELRPDTGFKISVSAGGGTDTITGSEWEDGMGGGDGDDTLNGGVGDDSLSGNAGTNQIEGGPGVDRLNVSGTDGDDTITAPDGAGQVGTSQETDTYSSIEVFSLRGQGGNDTITSGSGGDTLRGGEGNDVLNGGAGDDFVFGDAGIAAPPASGHDVLNGGTGADQIWGEAGNDEITSRDDSADTVNCGSETDSVVADALDVIDECETVDRGTPPLPAPEPVPPPPPVIQPPVTPPPPLPRPPTHIGPGAPPRCVVPNVKGKTVARARTLLSTRRCRLGRVARAFSRTVKKGKVIGQNRRPGLRLALGTRINVVVSRGRRG